MGLQTISFTTERKMPALDLPELLVAPRSDPVYNCHAYLTKVPIAAIRPFVEAFTEPGQVVADFFAGSGMTGLAAVKAGRKAALSDISILGCHIARGYLTRVKHEDFLTLSEQVITEAKLRLGDLYTSKRLSDGAAVEMVRTVWSFSYRCPQCSSELVYFRHIAPNGAPPSSCPTCGGPFARRTWKRGPDVPVQVVIRGQDDRLAEQEVGVHDHSMIAAAQQDSRAANIPSLEIESSREMYSRSGLRKAGLKTTKDFFSARNAIALFELWQAIKRVSSEPLRQKLLFAFTAILPRASRRYQWSAKRPLNAQNQTYYIAPIYYEWNVFELFQRKVDAAIRSDKELYDDHPLLTDFTEAHATYSIASAERLPHLGDESVDYVFTDPPFGSNIFYSDMNLFHEAWLGTVTNAESEAVVHTTGTRKTGAQSRYEELLSAAFAEAYRVLKPGRHMSVVFGNSSGAIWGLVQRALRDSGFDPSPTHVAVLDKGQRSVKGLNSGSESVVTVDLILTVRKPIHGEPRVGAVLGADLDPTPMIQTAIASLDPAEAVNPSHVYARILRDAIHQHLPVDKLHLSDVLVALRAAGYSIDAKTGLLAPVKQAA